MNIENYIKDIKERANSFSICNCLDVWGNKKLYYGLYNNHIYTEGAETLEQLVKEHPELKKLISRR